MKKIMKWAFIVGGIFFVLIVVVFLVVPMFVDIQKYKPVIEKKVEEATGRSFKIGGNLQLSLFPWVGLVFSDLHLGNPPGFEEPDFIRVKFFEARVRLFPLFFKDIQVERFVLEGPRIVLERGNNGRGNWEGIGKLSEEVPSQPPKKKEKLPESRTPEGFPIKAIDISEFAITGGNVIWLDHSKGERREISDVTLRLRDVSLDRPIHLAFSARLDDRPLSLEGKVGPLGKDPGKGAILLDLAVNVMKKLDISLKGRVVDPVTRPRFDLALKVSPFSPRRLAAALKQTFPITTADPEALSLVAFKAHLKGDLQDISVLDGVMVLDESKAGFSIRIKDFSKPDVTFDLKLDRIDIDRYLPLPSEDYPGDEKKKIARTTPGQKKTDYTPLHTLILDGSIRVEDFKVYGATIQGIYLKAVGKNGQFRLDPLTLNLYQGDISAKGSLDVRQDIPRINVQLHAKGIRVGPLLKDILKKDFLEGILKAEVALHINGDDAESIKRTLNGRGEFFFKEGTIVGIDLAGMIRNIKAAFASPEKKGQKPRTDFTELHSSFVITDGVVNTPNTSLISPFFQIAAAGTANLVEETLDFRLEPKFVTAPEELKNNAKYSELEVPVLVTGAFSSPRFRPDLKGILKKRLERELLKMRKE